MARASDLLELARSQLGVKESPPGSNRVKYNTAYYGREVSGPQYPWCCAFIWWLFREAGASGLFFGGQKTASCTTLRNWYRGRGQSVPAAEAKPGDLVFFVFDGGKSGGMNHIGVCERAEPGYITTIDGNTGTGSEANGGAVMRRRRALKYVGGVARPNYESEDDDMTQEQFNDLMDKYIAQISAQEPSPWSREAREWAEGRGIINGDETGRKKYKKPCTREELVQILFNQSKGG